MKKFIKLLTVILLLASVLSIFGCGKNVGGDEGSKVSWKNYGLGSTFRNSSGTCELTLREVVATESIKYDGVDYSGKSENMLVVKADAVFKDYCLDKWGVQFYGHYLNYQKISGAYNICSIKEDNGFELALTRIVNPEFDFNALKHNYSGELFMIFCLDEQNYSFLETQKDSELTTADNVQLELHVDDMSIKGTTIVRIGCLFNEVEFKSNYNIN